MRRLTEFEKDIVRKIYNAELNGIEFEELIWFNDSQDFIIKVGIEAMADGEVPQINLFTKALTNPNHPSSPEIIRRYYSEFKKFFDALNLLHLLKENGFIYLDSTVFLKIADYFPFVKESQILESDLNGIILEDKGIKEIFYNISHKEISENDVELLLNTVYQPTAALEIYVQNGFKTEDQRLSDEALAHNKRTTIISWLGIGAAILGVFVSGLFSALSYFDSIADGDKNDAFKNEVIVQVDNITKVVEGIRKDLNSTKPTTKVQAKKP